MVSLGYQAALERLVPPLALRVVRVLDLHPRRHGRLNYGFDRIRLIAPVPAGSRIRGHFVLKEVVDRGPHEIMARTEVTVEIEGGGKPALVADWLGLTRFV